MMITLSLSVCALFAGGEKEETANNGKPDVVAVNFPAYDFARQIAGDRVNLTMLLPPGAESHSFEPTPRDIIKIQDCDVFIYTGGETDVWVDRIFESMDTSKKKIIRMMDAVDVVEEEIVEGMEDDEDDHGHDHEDEEEAAYDEHVWTSPKNAQRIVRVIAEALCEADAADAAFFRRNADAYSVQLDELDKEFQAVVNNAKRKTIVFGDRFPFRYFADAYGLTYFAAFPGCSTETEPSAATVAFLIGKIKAEKIPVVFHIELSNEKMADTIAEETGAKKRLLHAAHNISKRDVDNGVTFLEIQNANVPNLKEALQ
jgi:zinc transport system substrate-binding protein